jgi:bacillithiol biosynthesis deacetylase BshB1
MKLDVLAFASHPDDAELSCSGTLSLLVEQGYKVGIADLTRGEMGTRGNPQIRAEEAKQASDIIGLSIRENLEMPDLFFDNNWLNQVKIIGVLRKYQPDVVIANAVSDRHPDHGRAALLIRESFFKSGLPKVETVVDHKPQEPFRPRALYHFIQTDYIEPDFIVDISAQWEVKMASIRAYKSQFYDPGSAEPETFISKPGFLEFIEARAKVLGHRIGVRYGEGFTAVRTPGVRDLTQLI